MFFVKQNRNQKKAFGASPNPGLSKTSSWIGFPLHLTHKQEADSMGSQVVSWIRGEWHGIFKHQVCATHLNNDVWKHLSSDCHKSCFLCTAVVKQVENCPHLLIYQTQEYITYNKCLIFLIFHSSQCAEEVLFCSSKNCDHNRIKLHF